VKKALLCIFCLCFIVSGTFAQFSIDKINAGGNLGANMNSREGWAFTFGVHGDYEIIDNLKAGVQLGFSAADDMFVFEPSVYGKYYLPFLSFFGFTPFAQLDLGASVLNITEEKTYGRFLFGIAAGLRYEIGKIYIEPKLTWGYPFMLAFNASVGYSF
jgi:hypothetical protein